MEAAGVKLPWPLLLTKCDEWGTEGDRAVSFAWWCGPPHAIGRHPPLITKDVRSNAKFYLRQ
jgi:hypothetical protein